MFHLKFAIEAQQQLLKLKNDKSQKIRFKAVGKSYYSSSITKSLWMTLIFLFKPV